MIDWNGRLEAVHEDGRVVAVEFIRDYGDDHLPMQIEPPLDAQVGKASFFNRDGSRYTDGWAIRNVKEEKAVTEFRVGDRVRAIDGTCTLKVGEVYTVASLTSDGNPCVDVGINDVRWYESGRFELVDRAESTEELATLRAFKKMALERYPDLGGPESDQEAAERFDREYMDGVYDLPKDMALAAIAWARANPRD